MRAAVRWLVLCVAAALSLASTNRQGARSVAYSGDSPPGDNPAARTFATSRRPCTSDYECAYGEQCLKSTYAITGSCATALNEFGGPTFSPPRRSSAGPGGLAECAFLSDCPVGFRCDTRGGSSGHCVR